MSVTGYIFDIVSSGGGNQANGYAGGYGGSAVSSLHDSENDFSD